MAFCRDSHRATAAWPKAAARFPIRGGEILLQGVVTPCKSLMGETFDVLYCTL